MSTEFEHRITDRLSAGVDHLPVGPPPLGDIRHGAARARRRQRLLAGAGGVAAIALVGVGVTVLAAGDDAAPAPVAGRDEPGDVVVAPDGMRLVGLNGVAIAVPQEWPTNEVTCGQPTATTVVVDQGPVCMMFVPFPADTDAVEVQSAQPPEVTQDWTPTTIAGLDALLSPTMSSSMGKAGGPDEPAAVESPTVTSTQVYFPDQGVGFKVSSSISEQHVEDLLAGIVALGEDQATVPFTNDLEGGGDGTLATYTEQLAAAGLVLGEVTGPDGADRRVLTVDPTPGSVLLDGDAVAVTTEPPPDLSDPNGTVSSDGTVVDGDVEDPGATSGATSGGSPGSPGSAEEPAVIEVE